MSGFSIILGGPEGDGGDDSEKKAALAAVKKFQTAKDPELALEAFQSLCRYHSDQMDSKSKKDDEGY